MKKIFLFCILVFFIGCRDGKYYSLYKMSFIPEENKQKYQECIEKIVKSASFHMTTSDYEHVDDTIEKARQIANDLYTKGEFVLQIDTYKEDTYMSSIKKRKEELTQEELSIYYTLLENGNVTINKEYKQ
jgi:hypothetical protein